jgi:ribosomal protein L40E
MPRYGPPADGDRFAGLRQRRRERGLATGRISETRPCGFCGASQPTTATHCDECGAYMRSEDEAGHMNTSDGLGS